MNEIECDANGLSVSLCHPLFTYQTPTLTSTDTNHLRMYAPQPLLQHQEGKVVPQGPSTCDAGKGEKRTGSSLFLTGMMSGDESKLNSIFFPALEIWNLRHQPRVSEYSPERTGLNIPLCTVIKSFRWTVSAEFLSSPRKRLFSGTRPLR